MIRHLHLNIIISALVAITSIVTLASCEVHSYDNGDLEGFWQLRSIEKLNGCKQKLYNTPMYWSFQAKLAEIRQEDIKAQEYFFRFDRSKDSLRLYSPILDYRDKGDIPVTDPTELFGFGIFHLDETFCIDELNSETMVLHSDSIKAYFRKY